MQKRMIGIAALACLALLAPLGARAQQDQTVYTFAAVWQVPHADWGAYSDAVDKNTKPVLERLMADGTVIAWGTYENLVHSADQETHGIWYSATSLESLTKALLTLRATTTSNSPLVNSKHWDFLGQCDKHSGTATAESGAYLRVGAYLAKPGRSGDFVKWFQKYYQPTLDALQADGTLLGYEIDRQYVHSDNPNWAYVVTIARDAASLEKAWATIAGLAKKRSPEENKAIGDQETEMLVPDAHRDMFARATHYAHK